MGCCFSGNKPIKNQDGASKTIPAPSLCKSTPLVSSRSYDLITPEALAMYRLSKISSKGLSSNSYRNVNNRNSSVYVYAYSQMNDLARLSLKNSACVANANSYNYVQLLRSSCKNNVHN